MEPKHIMEHRHASEPKKSREEIWVEINKATQVYQSIPNPTQAQKDAYAASQKKFNADMAAIPT